MSETKTPVGSTLRRTAIHSSMRGYMVWKLSALTRESLAVYTLPPNSITRASSSLRNSLTPGRLGKSIATFQPAIGKLSGARLPGPKSLKTFSAE